MFTALCQQRGLHLFQAHRADIECFGRDMESRGRARATIARRLCTIAGFYRYAVEEELLEHSPAVHVRRPIRGGHRGCGDDRHRPAQGIAYCGRARCGRDETRSAPSPSLGCAGRESAVVDRVLDRTGLGDRRRHRTGQRVQAVTPTPAARLALRGRSPGRTEARRDFVQSTLMPGPGDGAWVPSRLQIGG
jgi:hypothetical protein